MSRQRVVVVGSGGCGKSALTINFVAGKFCEEYDPTIEDCYNRTLDVDDEPACLEILDTAGQEELSGMRSSWYSQASAFLLCFSLTDSASLEEAHCFREEICRVAEAHLVEPVIVLCGTKSDLQSDREVAPSEAQSVAKIWKCSYIETSAKSGINVTEAFIQVVRDIRLSQIANEQSTKKPKSKKACSLL